MLTLCPVTSKLVCELYKIYANNFVKLSILAFVELFVFELGRIGEMLNAASWMEGNQ